MRPDGEGDPLERCPGERPPVMTDREPDRSAAQRRVVALAVPEDGDEEQAIRTWGDLSSLAVEQLEVGGAQAARPAAHR